MKRNIIIDCDPGIDDAIVLGAPYVSEKYNVDVVTENNSMYGRTIVDLRTYESLSNSINVVLSIDREKYKEVLYHSLLS